MLFGRVILTGPRDKATAHKAEVLRVPKDYAVCEIKKSVCLLSVAHK